MKCYCQECGSSHEYTVKKPNFCHNCGKSINKVAAIAQQPKIVLASEEEYDDEEGLEDSEAQVPKINKLDFDFNIDPSSMKGIKLGSLMGSQPDGEKFERPKERLSTKEILEEYKREAGALRPSSRTRRNKE